MKHRLIALALVAAVTPAGATSFIIDASHGKDLYLPEFTFDVPFVMALLSGPASAFDVSFEGLITADARWCSGFPPGEEPAECLAPIIPVFGEDRFTVASPGEKADLILPFYLSGTADGHMHFSATDGGSVRIDIQGATAVPEPAIWATMLGGFALTGGLLRLRRGRLAIAFG